jgi:hypothetical protein
MKVLVVGTTPPGGGPYARALAAAASARRDAGDEVELLAPIGSSAAHESSRLDGLFLALRLWWASRRFEALELRVEPGLPCSPTTGRLGRAAYLAALGWALAGFGEVTLRLDSPIPIPGGLGGRATTQLWGRASRIVTFSSDDAGMVERTPGVSPGIVTVAEPAPLEPPRPLAWPAATDPGLRTAVMTVVRERAAADRRAAAGIAAIGVRERPTRPGSPSSLAVARTLAEAAVRRAVRVVRAQRGR